MHQNLVSSQVLRLSENRLKGTSISSASHSFFSHSLFFSRSGHVSCESCFLFTSFPWLLHDDHLCICYSWRRWWSYSTNLLIPSCPSSFVAVNRNVIDMCFLLQDALPPHHVLTCVWSLLGFRWVILSSFHASESHWWQSMHHSDGDENVLGRLMHLRTHATPFSVFPDLTSVSSSQVSTLWK